MVNISLSLDSFIHLYFFLFVEVLFFPEQKKVNLEMYFSFSSRRYMISVANVPDSEQLI